MQPRRWHFLSVRAIQNGPETDYIAECACGWCGLPWGNRANALTEKCEVLEAELVGAQRRAKYRGLAQSA